MKTKTKKMLVILIQSNLSLEVRKNEIKTFKKDKGDVISISLFENYLSKPAKVMYSIGTNDFLATQIDKLLAAEKKIILIASLEFGESQIFYDKKSLIWMVRSVRSDTFEKMDSNHFEVEL
jgi:hypothetical protein